MFNEKRLELFIAQVFFRFHFPTQLTSTQPNNMTTSPAYLDSESSEPDDHTTQSVQQPPSQVETTTFYDKSMLISLIIFSLFYIFDPSQPFLVEYFRAEKQIPSSTVVQSIFPIWSYSLLPAQLLVGILSETRIGHRWIIVAGIFSNLLTLACILISKPGTIWLIQLTEVTVAFSFATHSSFFALRYHITGRDKYQFVTALTRGCMLLGSVMSSMLGQGLYLIHGKYPEIVPLRVLFYISMLGVGPCIIIALLKFPSPKAYQVPMVSNDGTSLWNRTVQFSKQVWTCYRNANVIYWSIFIIIAVPIHHLAMTYYQTLFKFLSTEDTKVWNGFVVAIAYLIAGLLSLVPTRFETLFDINITGQLTALILSCVSGMCLWFLSQHVFTNMLFVYALFICYHALFELLLVLAMSQIAKSMKVTRFAAIFSFNALLQNVLQVIIQAVMSALVLNVKQVYMTLSIGMFAVTPVLLIVIMIITRFIVRC
jgi:hypothetical protein